MGTQSRGRESRGNVSAFAWRNVGVVVSWLALILPKPQVPPPQEDILVSIFSVGLVDTRSGNGQQQMRLRHIFLLAKRYGNGKFLQSVVSTRRGKHQYLFVK